MKVTVVKNSTVKGKPFFRNSVLFWVRRFEFCQVYYVRTSNTMTETDSRLNSALLRISTCNTCATSKSYDQR